MTSSVAPRTATESPPPRFGPSRWLSSEWGLSALALILAILVWAVMWDKISEADDVEGVEVVPQTSERYVAFPRGTMTVKLEGPRGEREDARARLGDPASVVVHIDDLPLEDPVVTLEIADSGLVSFPFPRRLVQEITPVIVEVFRLEEHRVTFQAPKIEGLFPGFDADVTLEPESAIVRGPYGKVGETIRPDPVSVVASFDGTPGELTPPEAVTIVTFNTWREDPEAMLYRSGIALPEVRVRVKFVAVGERLIRNRILFDHPAGYEVTPEPTAQVGSGYYEGRFVGRESDLQRLEDEKDAWWFVVRIPGDALPTDDQPKPASLPIEYAHVSSLDFLRVRFPPPRVIGVDIKRAP